MSVVYDGSWKCRCSRLLCHNVAKLEESSHVRAIFGLVVYRFLVAGVVGVRYARVTYHPMRPAVFAHVCVCVARRGALLDAPLSLNGDGQRRRGATLGHACMSERLAQATRRSWGYR